jgi:hypothetical protein
MNLVAKEVQAAATADNKRKDPFFFEKSRLMVIAINATNRNLMYRAQTRPNGPWEADWSWINRDNTYAIMAAGLARDGRVVALAQTTGAPAVHFYIETPESTGGRQGWERPVNLGMPGGVAGFGQLATCRGANGKVQVFGLANGTGNVWWIFENPDRIVNEQVTITPPGQQNPITITVPVLKPPLTPWSAWQPLAPRKLDVITAANNGDGTISLAGSAFDDATFRVFYTRQTSVNATKPSDWTPWRDLTAGRLDASAPTLRLDPFGSLNVFARGGKGPVYTRQVPADADTFMSWALPTRLNASITHIATGIDGDGDIVFAAQDANGNVYLNTVQDVESQLWSGWQLLGTANGVGPMTLEYNSDGRLTLFIRHELGDQMLWCTSQIAFNSNAWEVAWTLLSNSALARYGVVRDLTPPASAFA